MNIHETYLPTLTTIPTIITTTTTLDGIPRDGEYGGRGRVWVGGVPDRSVSMWILRAVPVPSPGFVSEERQPSKFM